MYSTRLQGTNYHIFKRENYNFMCTSLIPVHESCSKTAWDGVKLHGMSLDERVVNELCVPHSQISNRFKVLLVLTVHGSPKYVIPLWLIKHHLYNWINGGMVGSIPVAYAIFINLAAQNSFIHHIFCHVQSVRVSYTRTTYI